MAVTAQSIILRVVTTLQDSTSIRWAANELVRYLNDGQREIAMLRPDSTATTASLTLSAGAKQSIPTAATKLVDVLRNTSGTKRAVRFTTRALLDSQVPSWYNLTGVTEIQHYMYDVRDPRVFYVYPPAASSGASVEIVYSAVPTAVTEPSNGATYTDVSGNIGLPDVYANALADYILYRAFTKDSEFGNNVTRAQNHYSAFSSALGADLTTTSNVAP